MLGGYAGKILEVDLDSGELKDLPLDEEMSKDVSRRKRARPETRI